MRVGYRSVVGAVFALALMTSLAEIPLALAADAAKKTPPRTRRGESASAPLTAGGSATGGSFGGGSSSASASGGGFSGGSASGGGFSRGFSGGNSAGGGSNGGSISPFGNFFGGPFGQTFSSGSSSSSSGGGTSRSVTVGENGKTVSINEDSRTGITVKITETIDGTPTTTTVQASNAAELAKNHPAAYELYQRYLGGGNGQQVSVQGGTASSAASSSRGNAKRSSSRSGTAGHHGSSASAGPGKTEERLVVPSGGIGDARALLREQLEALRQQHADDPAVAQMLDEAIRSLEPVEQEASSDR